MSRDELIIAHTKLVRTIARGLARKLKAEEEEFVAAGMIGLIEAADRYDPTRNTSFARYAQLRIAGAVMDNFRRQDTLTKSERELRKLDPTRALVGPGALFHAYRIYDMAAARAVGQARATTEDPHRPLVRRFVCELLNKLPERLARVLVLYHVEDKTFREIGELLGVTETRVMQLRNEAAAILRKRLDRQGVAFSDVW